MERGQDKFLRPNTSIDQIVGRAVPRVTDWQHLNLDYVVKAHIDQAKCIQCGRCHIACEDTSHQAISRLKDGKRHYEVIEAECVGCNLCAVVCPVSISPSSARSSSTTRFPAVASR